MENKQNINNKIRKIHKIKRPKTQETCPVTIDVPSKINDNELEKFLQSNITENQTKEKYFSRNGDVENLHFITDEELQKQQYRNITTSVLLRNKSVLALMVGAAVFGFIISSILFSSSGTTNIARGLDGIVVNPDVPAGRNRCGLVEPHQGCVLYIMNPRNQEVIGRDFFSTAAKWTNRERYIIEVGNMKYNNVRIKPGYIAQINIPPLSY